MKQFVLVDCNNFFVSCQRIFDPSLEGRPVLVLSSNDGCVIARSQETKGLGIKMGEPFFKIKEFCDAHSIKVFSSNFELYGDISDRVMTILSHYAEEMEIYSIDEAFLTFSEGEDLFPLCAKIRATLKQWVGIPTSLGIAPTKCLAKVATSLAKKEPSGLRDLRRSSQQKKVLAHLPIEEIWGIGRGLSKRLNAMGIYTAEQLIQSDPYTIRRICGVVGERIFWELQGVSCLPLEWGASAKSITCSRSFGRVVTAQQELEEAIATHVARAAVKLRTEGQLVRSLHVFLEKRGEERGNMVGGTVPLPYATDHTPTIIRAAKVVIASLFQEGKGYRKCGVTFVELVSSDDIVPDLFVAQEGSSSSMEVVDAINARFGKDTLFFAAMGMKKGRRWEAKRSKRTGSYSTKWDQLAVVKA